MLEGLTVSAGGMTVLSVAAGSAVAGPADGPIMTVFCVSWVPAESCITACPMAVITNLDCHRAVA